MIGAVVTLEVEEDIEVEREAEVEVSYIEPRVVVVC